MVRQWWWAGWAWGLGRRQGGTATASPPTGRYLGYHNSAQTVSHDLCVPRRTAGQLEAALCRASVCCALLTAHSCALPSRFRRASSALPTRRLFGGGNCTSGGVQGGVARADGAGAADGLLSRLRANVAFQATSLAFNTVGRWQAADEGARALRPVRQPANHTQLQPAAVATETLIGDCFWSKSDLRW